MGILSFTGTVKELREFLIRAEKAEAIVELSIGLTLEDVLGWSPNQIELEYFRLIDSDATIELPESEENDTI